MSLHLAHERLDWPLPETVINPLGAGASVLTESIRQKIGHSIARRVPELEVRCGVLLPDPGSAETEAPWAIVVEFSRAVARHVLDECHRLAWNFCRAPLLVTLEPHVLRAWSCYEPPSTGGLFSDSDALIDELTLDFEVGPSVLQTALRALRWSELASGRFFADYERYFERNKRADRLLLDNLRFVREKLLKQGLDSDISHDLLARIIFLQFLSDRKDSKGIAALNATFFARLHGDGTLGQKYGSLSDILASKSDTYGLFRWMNDHFNGDLFPGESGSEAEREAEWKREMEAVGEDHLRTLAEFVSGNMKMSKGQRSLWPHYSFDTIPLEFISSIYEVFIQPKKRKGGVVYTPAHLVDTILDIVLPWSGDRWNLKVLDPACGSGIFLVKVFQRLINRWKSSHPDTEVTSAVLRQILERNLFGVDIDPQAVRVASFSLYLAMCDEIDPRHYWTQVKFPRLRNRTLISSDFFVEDRSPFQTKADAGTFDLIVGNAPWGKGTLTGQAKRWARSNKWKIASDGIGGLFLAKSRDLLKDGSSCSMIQSAGSMLFNRESTANAFREMLFRKVNVDHVLNLSALRFGLFAHAVSPSCVVTISKSEPKPTCVYVCPKPRKSKEDDYQIVVEAHDVVEVFVEEMLAEPTLWCTYMWGARRDASLVSYLKGFDSLLKLREANRVATREGVIRGDGLKEQRVLLGKPMLNEPSFPTGTFLTLDPSRLPNNTDASTHSRDSTNFDAFKVPQLIIKQAWQAESSRFSASTVETGRRGFGVLCTQSYISCSSLDDGDNAAIRCAAQVYSSKTAVYFAMLTSGRFASYRPEPLVEELLSIPLPESLDANPPETLSELDERIYSGFKLREPDIVLVEDMFNVTLQDFKGGRNTPGQRPTTEGGVDRLTDYRSAFCRVLSAGFGPSAAVIGVTSETDGSEPFRLFCALVGGFSHSEVIPAEQILKEYREKALRELRSASDLPTVLRESRTIRIYDQVNIGGQIGGVVCIYKPNYVRYWTRSVAMRDADETFLDLMSLDKAQFARHMEGSCAD